MSAQSTTDAILQLKKTLEQLALSQQTLSNTNASTSTGHVTSPEPVQYSKEHLYAYSEKYLDFTYSCPTIYHVVSSMSKFLTEKGFVYISEKDLGVWEKLEIPGKYYTYRNGTNLCAFTIGKDWKPEYGVGVIGSHIDALHAKLKPASIKSRVGGFELLGVAPYGGTLNELWVDRDLGIGGRVIVEEGEGKDQKFVSKLIDSTPHPIARIPSLAPHFGEAANMPYDKEDQAVPVIGYFSADDENEPTDKPTDDEKNSPLFGKHSIHVLRYVAQLAGVKVSQLKQLDLELFDVQKGVFAGIKNDFIIGPRSDDRLCSFSALTSLIEYADATDLSKDSKLNVVCLYDNEEIGSLSRQGAKGGLMESTVSKIISSRFVKDSDATSTIKVCFSNSFIISADVIHMDNPNFTTVYLDNHKPKPNVGLTISLDSNGHMATDVVGTSVVEEIGRINGDKLQYFQIKNNSRSGGTIGPSIASQTGARTIDMGIAQWSMHSIRSSTGSKDVGLAIKFFKGYFESWRSVYDKFGDL